MSAEPRGHGIDDALRQGLRALLMRRPRADLRFDAATVFALLVPLLLLLDVGFGWFTVAGRYGEWSMAWMREFPRTFSAEGAIATLAALGALLLAAWLAVLVLGRRAAFWSLAAPLGAAWIGFSLLAGVLVLVMAFNVDDPARWYQRLRPALAAFWLLVAWRLLAGFARSSPAPRRAVAAMAIAVVTVGGMWLHAWPDYWVPDHHALAARMQALEDDAPRPPPVDHEAVIYAQPRLLQQALGDLEAQRPGTVDFYALGFAGDGDERVFANEVRHFARLAGERFDAAGRTLTLANSAHDPGGAPMATLTALAGSLDALATRMDPAEDVLLLYLTTHGSEDHQLLVQLGDLPLSQIEPTDLAGVLEASGIRWRIVMVSACFSGGFLEPLADPNTIVITAAREDRSSFGCGMASDITWFGKAFLVDALNRERDPVKAFALATADIAARERADELTPSEPQIHVGSEIGQRLPGWIEALPPAAPVPFELPD